MPAISEPEPATVRERYRAQVRSEVKQAALAQLAQAGPAGVSISAIGKQLGISGPGLYRYFASRDELLTELAIDAYHDLADALAAAAGHAPGPDPRGRLEALARAYRSWALAQPHRYRLLFGPPLPGYDAHAQRLIDASWHAMNPLLGILGEPGDRATAPPPEPLASQLAAWAKPYDPGTSPAAALRAVLVWSRLHGIVSLEIAGNFASMGIDPGQLFETQLATLTAGPLPATCRPAAGLATQTAGRDPAAFAALVELAELAAIPVAEPQSAVCASFPRTHPLHPAARPSPGSSCSWTSSATGSAARPGTRRPRRPSP